MNQLTNYKTQFTIHFSNRSDEYRIDKFMSLVYEWIGEIIDMDLPPIRKEKFQYNNEAGESLEIDWHGSAVGIKLENPDREPKHAQWRRWETQIGAQFNDDGTVYFSLINSFKYVEGYIGSDVDTGVSTPRLVSRILRSKDWNSEYEGYPLKVFPTDVDHDSIKSFIDMVFDESRKLPLIYVSRTKDNVSLIDARELSKKVAGNALVYIETENSVGEFHEFKPNFKNYRCKGGSVRVYLPGANSDIEEDWTRHRFFTSSFILQNKEVVEVIAKSIVRRSVLRKKFTVYGVESIQQLRSVEQLNEALRSKNNDEIISAYRTENESLKKQIEALKAENSELCTLYDNQEDELDRVREDRNALQVKCDALEGSFLEVEKEAVTLSDLLPELPQTIEDVVNLFKLKSKRLIILDEAVKSSRKVEVRDLNKAWRLLSSLENQAYDLFFNEVAGDKKRIYHEKTGFNLAMTEGTTTKKNKDLVRQRVHQYKDEDVQMLAHVGFGSKKPNMLRVHFHIDNEDKVLVIGHCGDHLDNSTTRKL